MTTLVDYFADQISPYAFVALFPLGFFSKNNLCIYGLFIDICFLVFTGIAKGFLIMMRKNWFSIAWRFVKQFFTGAWLGLVLGITNIYRYWFGKVTLLMTSGILAAHLLIWTYNYINLAKIFRATLDFLQAIPQFIRDAPELIRVTMIWLRTIFVGYMIDISNEYWQEQIDGSAKKDPTWIFIGLIVILVAIAIAIFVARFEVILNWIREMNQPELQPQVEPRQGGRRGGSRAVRSQGADDVSDAARYSNPL